MLPAELALSWLAGGRTFRGRERIINLDRLASIVSPRTYEIMNTIREDSTAGTGGWLAKPPMLDSMRFFPTAHMTDDKSVGASTGLGWAAVGDFREYVIGLRLEPNIIRLKERYADQYSAGLLFNFRMDAVPVRDANFKRLINIST